MYFGTSTHGAVPVNQSPALPLLCPTGQVDSARAENANLRSEVDGVRRAADDSKDAEANRRDIENMRGEIVMLSKTFSDFVRRYRQVATNKLS